MKKKILFLLLIVAVLSMSLFLLTACIGVYGDGAHEHVSLRHAAAVAPTCTEDGNVEYWYCPACGKYFRDEQCTDEIKGGVTLPAGHAVPTTYQTSETEHWYVCEKCEEEQRGEHEYGGDRECDICGYKLSYTPGLQYENIDSETCKVTGIGTATAETDMIIPDTHEGRKVVEIAKAFYNCSNLTSITIPASVTTIFSEAFRFCSSLERIDVDPGNTAYSSQDGVLYNPAKTEIICVPGGKQSVTIPASVTTIGSGAFRYCSSLERIDVDPGNTVYSSQDGILYDPSKTEIIRIPGGKQSVTIPANVTSIDDNAFGDCDNLMTVNWNATNCTYAGSGSYYYAIFDGCTSLTTVNIGENVQTIPEYAFYGCSKLTEITIPASVTSIDDNAFAYCDNLQTVNWDATNCTKAGSLNDTIFYGCTSLTTVNIGENVEIIPDYAFYVGSMYYGCSNITEITIPANVTSIGYWAFRECTNLQTVTFDGDSKLETIGTQAFYDCGKLKSITIPASVTSIGIEAFSECTSLQAVNFENPDGWKVSRYYSMSNSTTLSSEKLKNQLTAAQYLKNTYDYWYWRRS